EINPFGIGAVTRNAKLNAEESAAGRCGDIDIDDAVAQLEVFHGCGSAIEEEALAALILSRLRLAFQDPQRRVRGNGERLRCLAGKGIGRRGSWRNRNIE